MSQRVRTIELDVLQANGTIATVSMDVVSVRDADGNPLTTDRIEQLLKAIYQEIQALRFMTGRATGQQFAGLPAMAAGIGDIAG